MSLQPKSPLPHNRELYLNIYFSLREGTNWADAGHIVATGQLRLTPSMSVTKLLDHRIMAVPAPLCTKHALTVTQDSPHELRITANTRHRARWTLDLAQGCLTSWKRGDDPHEILRSPVTFDIYRALTNNDAGGNDPNGRPGAQGREWRDARVHLARNHSKMLSLGGHQQKQTWVYWRTANGTDVVQIRVPSRIAPPVLGWGIDVGTTYQFFASNIDGAMASVPLVRIQVQARASGPWVPPTIPRFGLAMGLRGCHSASWFGRGPGESYRDKKESQLIGTYSSPVDELFTDYEVPQDNGNRTDVRWVEFLRDSGDTDGGIAEDKAARRLLRARFGDLEGASFSVSRYSTRELDTATHPYELRAMAREREDEEGEETTWVHLDWVHHGLGTGSCGTETLPQYSLDQKSFEFEIVLD